MISEVTKRLLCLSSDKIWAMDTRLEKEFGVVKKIRTSWTRTQPYPTSELDALQVMRTLKSEWDEKSGLYETLSTYGAKDAIVELAKLMGIDE